MYLNSKLSIFMASIIFVFASHTSIAMTEQQKKMLDQLDQLDRLDRLDHLEFQELNDQAKACIRNRDFKCAESKILSATNSVSNPQDKEALRLTRDILALERKQAEKDRQLAEQAEQRRIAQANADAQRRQKQEEEANSFQWGKAAALLGGAAIGGLDKLPAEAQGNLVTGILKDSMPEQTGISNFQGGLNNQSNAATGGSSGQGGGMGGVSKATFNAGELACQKEADRSARPYNDSQLDTFCVLATSNDCVRKKFNFTGYEAERQESCLRMKQTAKALNLNPNLCGGCP